MGPDRQLRLALSMRGGVSLAVWIGGATQEIDRLRRSKPKNSVAPRGLRFHHGLLNLADFQDVVIDVITGASAGGLNGVLLSWAILSGGELEGLRALWVKDGSFDRLLSDESGWGALNALLKGDDYFYGALKQALTEMGAHVSGHPRRHLQVIAAGTLRESASVRIGEDESTRADEHRSDAYFHVARLGPGTLGLDGFDAPDIQSQLALIGRASSSFPAAFEPATVPMTTGLGLVDLQGRFSEPARPGHVVRVIDGGVLDNIPVARAIRAIASASANQPTDRVLLFLHPDPGQAAFDHHDQDDALGVVRSLSEKRSECLLTDIDELRLHNARVAVRKDERDLVLRGFNEGHFPSEGAAIELRCRLDVESILRCLIDPATEIPWHPPTVRRFGRPIDGWTSGGVEDLRAALKVQVATVTNEGNDEHSDVAHEAGAALTAMVELLTSPQNHSTIAAPSLSQHTPRPFEPARRVSRFLIGTCRSIERLRATSGVDVRDDDRLGVVKQQLYDIQLLAELASSYNMGLAPGHLVDTDEDAATVALNVVASMCASARDLARSPRLVRAVEAAAIGTLISDEHPNDEVDGAIHAMATWNRDSFVDEPDGELNSVLVALWKALADHAVELATLVDPRNIEVPEAEHPNIHAVRKVARAGRPEGIAASLEALDRALIMLDAQPLPGEQTIRFVRVAGSARSPLEGLLGFGHGLPKNPLDPQPQMKRADKLTGSQLFHFGAFLNARWRANDWMWGEMDAAVSLVDLLVTPETIRDLRKRSSNSSTSPIDRVVDRIRSMVVDAPPAGFDMVLSEWWNEAEPAVRNELRDVLVNDRSVLNQTKQILLARRHLEIAIERLSDVNSAPDEIEGAVPAATATATTTKKALEESATTYANRRRRISQDLGTTRLTRIGIRTALVTWRVFVRPRGRVKWGLAFLKPLYLAVVGLILNARRSLAAIAIVLSCIVATRSGGDGKWTAVVGATVFCGIGFGLIEWKWRLGRRSSIQAWIPRVIALGALGFGWWFALRASDPYKHPLYFAIAAAIVVWLVLSWMKLAWFLLIEVIVAGLFYVSRFIANNHESYLWVARSIWVSGLLAIVIATLLATCFAVTARGGNESQVKVRTALESRGIA